MTRDVNPALGLENAGHIVLLIGSVFEHQPPVVGQNRNAVAREDAYVIKPIVSGGQGG